MTARIPPRFQPFISCAYPQLLFSDKRVQYGASSVVIDIDDQIAIKLAIQSVILYDDVDIEEGEAKQYKADIRNKYRQEALDEEQEIYHILQSHPPHPNILQGLFLSPEATFLLRLPGNPQRRLKEPTFRRLEIQWVKEIADGLAWLESLGLVHGDLRLVNVLLDGGEHAKLCDFDGTVGAVEDLKAHSTHFSKQYGQEGGLETGLFSVGCTVYNIVTKQVPFHDIDDYDVVERRSLAGEFLSSEGIYCEYIIRRCWAGNYNSISEVLQEARNALLEVHCKDHQHLSALADIVPSRPQDRKDDRLVHNASSLGRSKLRAKSPYS